MGRLSVSRRSVTDFQNRTSNQGRNLNLPGVRLDECDGFIGAKYPGSGLMTAAFSRIADLPAGAFIESLKIPSANNVLNLAQKGAYTLGAAAPDILVGPDVLDGGGVVNGVGERVWRRVVECDGFTLED